MAPKPNGEVKAMEVAFNALSELKPDEKKRVLLWLWEKLEIGGPAPVGSQSATFLVTSGTSAVSAGMPAVPGAVPSAKSFLAQKDPKTDAERITCLAYYLTHYKATARFKTKELEALNVEAAYPKFSNAGVAVMNAAGSKYLSPAGDGTKQITVFGEKLVDALPDREKVKSLRKKPHHKSKKK